jgi:hypothetical protein
VTRELTGKDKRSRGNSHREEVPHPGRRPAGGGARARGIGARNRETLPAGARGARSPAGGTGRGTEDSTADSRVEEEGRVLGREGGRRGTKKRKRVRGGLLTAKQQGFGSCRVEDFLDVFFVPYYVCGACLK